MIEDANRQTTRTRRRHLKLICAALGAVAVAGALFETIRPASATPPPESLSSVSATSTPVTVDAASQTALARFQESGYNLGAVSLLSTSGQRSYYRIADSSGPTCYGVGYASTNNDLGQIECSPDFPSPERPVLDFTVMHGNQVWRSEGFASDDVATVSFIDGSGQLIDVTPVVHNVYYVTAPPSEFVKTIVARDSSGTVLWSESLPG